MVITHLQTQATRHNPQARYQWKLRLSRRLYERGYERVFSYTLSAGALHSGRCFGVHFGNYPLIGVGDHQVIAYHQAVQGDYRDQLIGEIMNETLHTIRQIVGPNGIVDDPQRFTAYVIDHRQLYHGNPALIVRPKSTAEVATIMKVCHDAGIGVVPQGGNTGYCGGATPDEHAQEILLNLERLNRVRDVDIDNFTMTVDAGVILADVQTAAEEAGMHFPLSLGAQGSCQIGGNVATNAGGVSVVRYGNARDLVLGLEVVLPDGRILNALGKLRKDNTGYDVKQLFLGAEGTLGIITAVVLKLFPKPINRQTAFLAVSGVDAACRLLGMARRLSGDTLTSFEYLSRPSLELVFSLIPDLHDPLEKAADHYVLLELSSSTERIPLDSILEHLLAEAMEQGLVIDGTIAQTGSQQHTLWRLREGIPEAERHAGGSIKHDISLPISNIPTFLSQVPEQLLSVDKAIRISVYGHIGDGNLHFNLLAASKRDPDEFKRSSGPHLSRVVHDLAQQLAGSFSAEHGVGKLKRDLLLEYKDATALAVMRAVKSALDPKGIMNPGKIVDADHAHD